MADVDEIERALTGAIEKRILEGSGKLSKITTIDGVVQVTFLDVTDDGMTNLVYNMRRFVCLERMTAAAG